MKALEQSRAFSFVEKLWIDSIEIWKLILATTSKKMKRAGSRGNQPACSLGTGGGKFVVNNLRHPKAFANLRFA
jgi:hypothetical protein